MFYNEKNEGADEERSRSEPSQGLGSLPATSADSLPLRARRDREQGTSIADQDWSLQSTGVQIQNMSQEYTRIFAAEAELLLALEVPESKS